MHHCAHSRGSCASPKLQLPSESRVSSNFLHRPSNGCCCCCCYCSRLRLSLMVHVFPQRGRGKHEPSPDRLAAGASTCCSLAARDYPSISPRAWQRCLSVRPFFPMNLSCRPGGCRAQGISHSIPSAHYVGFFFHHSMQ